MTKTYDDIAGWFKDCRNLVLDDWDNISLYTGEEGSGKSTLMRLVNRKLDSTFDVSRIHFTQEEYLEHARHLEEGKAIQLDEFRGHRRASMTRERMHIMDFLKECRGLNLHQSIGFPHATQLDRDIMRSRIRWWVHLPRRGFFDIRRRVAQVRTVRMRRGGEEPMVDVRYPVVGRFPFQDVHDEFRRLYLAKKEDYARRDRSEEDGGPGIPQLDVQAARLVLDKIRASLV